MNSEEKKLLEETNELAKENNHILKGIRRSNRFSMLFRFLYWIIIIGISVGAFYYVQPYIDSLMKVYKTVQTDLGTIKTITNKLPVTK